MHEMNRITAGIPRLIIFLVFHASLKYPLNTFFFYASEYFASLQVFTRLFFCIFLSLVTAQLDLPPLRDDRIDSYTRQPDDRLDGFDGFGRPQVQRPNDLDYRNVLARLDFLGAERCSSNVAAQWAYETNVNEYTQVQAVRCL